jgi:hypothetical protein
MFDGPGVSILPKLAMQLSAGPGVGGGLQGAAFDRGLAGARAEGAGMRPVDIAKALKIGRASVYRVLGQPSTAESA